MLRSNRQATTTGVPASEFTGDRVGGASRMFYLYSSNSPTGDPNEDKYYNHGNSAIAEAGFYKAANPNGLYTIALEAGDQGAAVLNQIASPGKAFTSTPNQLLTIFNQIAGQISSSVQNATVTDVMGSGVTVVGSPMSADGKTLTWDLGAPSFDAATNKYIYETTYRIQLNEDILGAYQYDGGFYPANASAVIKYNANQTGTFPVPKINPVFVDLSKELVGQDCAGCKFDITLTHESGSVETYTLKAGETKTLYHPMKVGMYTAEEVATSNNPLTLKQYHTEYLPNNKFSLTQASDDQGVTIKNIHDTKNVEVEKVWTGKKEAKATVILMADGAEVGRKDLDEANNWKHTFTDLSKLDKDGNEIVYSITETGVDSERYDVNVDDSVEDVFVVTNTYKPETTTITATKKWQFGEKLAADRKITLELWRKTSGGVGVKILGQDKELSALAGNEWSAVWNNMPKTDMDGNEYTYFIKEAGVSDEGILLINGSPYEVTYSDNDLTVTNSYKSPTNGTATVKKKWLGGDALERPTTYFKLYRHVVGGEREAVPEAEIKEIKAGEAYATWSGLTVTNSEGDPYIFEAEEVDADGNKAEWSRDFPYYWVDVSDENTDENTTVIMNVYKTPLKDVTVTKKWVGGLAPEAIDVQLYRQIGDNEAEKVGEVKTIMPGSSSVTWNNYEETDENGVEYKYFAKELTVLPNYSVSYDGLEITNTYHEPVVPGSGASAADTGQLAKTGVNSFVILAAAFMFMLLGATALRKEYK